MGKDLKDLEKDIRKSVEKTLEDDLAKDLKKRAQRMGSDPKGTDVKGNKSGKTANKVSKNDGWFIWALIVFLFLAGLSPIALILLLVKLFGGNGKKGSSAKAKNRGAGAAAKNAMKTPAARASTAKWLKIGGVVIMLIALLGNWDYLMWFLSGDMYWWEEVVQMAAGLIGGGVMFLFGRGMTRRLQRYAKYLAVMGDRESVSVEEIVRTLGYDRRQVERDLEKMIDQGYFGGKAYLHRELGCLLRSAQAEAEVREQRQAPRQAAAEPESEYAAILRNIRQANDRIADETLSAKIDRLEAVTARIFHIVEQEPEKKPRIQTFLNYYLPTTQKLLDSYAEFESAGVEGENLRQAKQRIESTMDKIVGGFEHQLDELYRAEAMDVDSDIRVMVTMLRRDTASAAEDFGAAVQSQKDAE